ncbi:hypothetical protein WMY93_026378 [Mugilogobius chulae]|uniref:Cysteine and tyrosine-rich protein 1 n=1 Tax=Mugilogobius chulae TaxID=88201 RepID=A0AAW0MX89_9GOBI
MRDEGQRLVRKNQLFPRRDVFEPARGGATVYGHEDSRFPQPKRKSTMSSLSYSLVGMICGSIFQIILCVGFISGCVSLCCWCHKRCRKRRQPQTSSGPFPLDLSHRPLLYPGPPTLNQNSHQPLPPDYAPPKYDQT